jgi:hypothetical protein
MAQQGVDHNIMRHLNATLSSNSYGEGFDIEDEEGYTDDFESAAAAAVADVQ